MAPMQTFDPTPFRAEAPLVTERAYLDHAAMAPLPRCSQAAAQAVFSEQAARGGPAYGDWLERAEVTRAAAARLLNG